MPVHDEIPGRSRIVYGVEYLDVNHVARELGCRRKTALNRVRRAGVRTLRVPGAFLVLASDFKRVMLLGLPANDDDELPALMRRPG